MKTLAIRLDDDLHSQLSAIASLCGLTVTDAIRQAIEQWIDALKSQPELAIRAQSMLEEIERDAATRRRTLAALFGPADEQAFTESSSTSAGPQTRGKRGAAHS